METRPRPTIRTISKTPSTPRLRWPVSEHFHLQSARSRAPRDDCRLCHTVLAATNKCLAQTNKSDTRAKATDKRRSDTGSAAQFRALAKLAKGKTRYWISAAGLLNDHWYVGSPPSSDVPAGPLRPWSRRGRRTTPALT